MRSQISARNLKKIKITRIFNQDHDVFVPNPGGQETLFEYVPLDQKYQNKIRWYYLRGGVGAGKSKAGSAFVVSRVKLYPMIRGLITAQSFPQLRDSTLVALVEYCFKYGHEITPSTISIEETARKIAYKQTCSINGVDILVKSIDAFTGVSAKSTESGRGIEVGWIWYDEGAYGQKQGFDTLNTRLRWNLEDYFCHALITSSINKNMPYNWTYDYFDSPDRKPELAKIHQTIVCSTLENVKGDRNYIKALKTSLTDELYKIEILSLYSSITENRVFNYFSREQHCVTGLEIDPRYPIHVSLDFNHNPSTAIAGQFLPASEEIVIVKEWYLKHSDTFQLSAAIAKWFLEIRGTRNRSEINNWATWNSYKLHVHGDASGNQKTANSKQSNWQIVRTTFKQENIDYQTHYGKSNPGIKDTVNSVNCALRSDKLWINNDCTELKKDLEGLKWDDKSQIDKKDIARSHLADGLRYMVENLLPYRKLIADVRRNQRNVKPTGVIF